MGRSDRSDVPFVLSFWPGGRAFASVPWNEAGREAPAMPLSEDVSASTDEDGYE
jgi:hypothetical protein